MMTKARPEYYLTPTHDFTQYTRDSEEKYWRKETRFDWGQCVADNLKKHVDSLSLEEFSRIAFMILPMIRDTLDQKIGQIRHSGLPVQEDALKDIAECIPRDRNHNREIQEAMTTFINDEAKHSATFRRFLVDKLMAKEYISDTLIKGANRYMWLARFMPSAGFFLAVIVEAIGAAYLEFFGDEKYMPDPLFCSISKTISMQDEQRHMDLCVGIYNELYRKGNAWERYRNRVALKVMIKAVYGDKTEEHHLIQAFRAFGVESDMLYQHIASRLSHQLARISMYITPDRLLEFIGNTK